jgi:chromosome segregation ATPase
VRIQLEAKQTQLQVQQSQAEQLALRIQSQAELHQSVLQLVEGTSGANLQNLEQMPLEQLQSTVHDLEQELEKLSRFVSSQEEELTLQQQEIDALRQQLQQASEYDRLRLDTEIADEQDRCQMLNETLVGQRRSLQERQVILTQHRTVLAKRQGFPLPEDAAKTIDLAPILTRIDRLRQDYAEQLQSLESQIQVLRAEIEPLQTEVTRQSEAQGMTWNELQQVEQQVAQAAELWGKVNTYEAMLQPAQDNLNLLRQQAEAASAALSHQQEMANQQQQAIQDMRETVQKLTGAPMAELAVS